PRGRALSLQPRATGPRGGAVPGDRGVEQHAGGEGTGDERRGLGAVAQAQAQGVGGLVVLEGGARLPRDRGAARRARLPGGGGAEGGREVDRAAQGVGPAAAGRGGGAADAAAREHAGARERAGRSRRTTGTELVRGRTGSRHHRRLGEPAL